MNVGDLVRIMDGGRAGMTGRVGGIGHSQVEIILTSTGESIDVPKGDFVPVDPTPQTTAQWRAEHAPWKKRNARVIARIRELRAA
jgi:hypothetical protein